MLRALREGNVHGTETRCPLYVSTSTRVRFSEKGMKEEEEEGGGLVNDVQENEEDEDEDEKEGKVITERERAPGCPRRVRPPLRPSSCKILPVSPFLEHRLGGLSYSRDLAVGALGRQIYPATSRNRRKDGESVYQVASRIHHP